MEIWTSYVVCMRLANGFRMHNGQISQFSKIKRRLLAALPEPLFLMPMGQTDSEYAFALYLSHLKDPETSEKFSYHELKEAMLRTIQDINQWSREAGIEEVRTRLLIIQPSLLNFCITDGESVVCTRYVSSKTDEAASLVRIRATHWQYFSTGTSFYEHAKGEYRMVKAGRQQNIVVIASEPLTFEQGEYSQLTQQRTGWRFPPTRLCALRPASMCSLTLLWMSTISTRQSNTLAILTLPCARVFIRLCHCRRQA